MKRVVIISIRYDIHSRQIDLSTQDTGSDFSSLPVLSVHSVTKSKRSRMVLLWNLRHDHPDRARQHS